MAINKTEKPPSSKRKRKTESKEELEIDLSLPEPLSKKDLRKAKKIKLDSKDETSNSKDLANRESESLQKESKSGGAPKEERRSQWGVWIGNLPWTIGKAELREFFCRSEDISEETITRVHLPGPSSKDVAKSTDKAKNRGFAYVDFDTQEAQNAALNLSETVLQGRNVLIKQANNFEGRPIVHFEPASAKLDSGKPPSRKIFVGNLGFEVTKEDVERHFSQCGDVELVFLATFEDSGKCKGFGWVTFVDIESAKSAVRGWIKVTDESADLENEDSAEKTKMRKKKVNLLHGRQLRCEFAEDQQARFRKRHGKEKLKQDNDSHEETGDVTEKGDFGKTFNLSSSHEQRREARKVAKYQINGKQSKLTPNSLPAKATGAIVASTGKTIVFD